MRGPAEEALLCVLTNIDVPQLTWATRIDGTQYHESRRHHFDSLTSKGITAWLCAYWMGRRLGIVKE